MHESSYGFCHESARCAVRRKGHLLALACVSLWLVSGPLGAAAPAAAQFECEGCVILDRAELAMQRGGFEFAGLKFEFGANIRSFIDNQLVLESMVSITSEGVIEHQLAQLPASAKVEGPGTPSTPAGSGSAAVPFQLHAPAAAGKPNTIPVPATPVQSNAATARTPANIDLSGLGNAFGVSVNDRKGYTAALHEATRERITGLIVNTASQRALRQELEVRVDVANFKQFQQSARQSLLNSRFGSAVLK